MNRRIPLVQGLVRPFILFRKENASIVYFTPAIMYSTESVWK